MDSAVIASVTELLEARHYPVVVAVCDDALEADPECTSLLLIRARARIALRRDLEAQADLRDIVRLDPGCGLAYRLLGELASRRDEPAAAAVYYREALRLCPEDGAAAEALARVEERGGPPSVAGSSPGTVRLRGPGVAAASAAGSLPRPTPREAAPASPGAGPGRRGGHAAGSVAPPVQAAGAGRLERPARPGRDAPTAARPEAPRRAAEAPAARAPRVELPGFGDYLVAEGILTPARLRAALAYQRSMGVHLATAVVTLGLASPQRVEWAVVAHQAIAERRPA